MEVKVNFKVYGGAAEIERHNPYRAEPGATANEHACHGSCSEQHAPRQARSSLSFNVRQNLLHFVLLQYCDFNLFLMLLFAFIDY
jgi:hypothetical protein